MDILKELAYYNGDIDFVRKNQAVLDECAKRGHMVDICPEDVYHNTAEYIAFTCEIDEITLKATFKKYLNSEYKIEDLQGLANEIEQLIKIEHIDEEAEKQTNFRAYEMGM